VRNLAEKREEEEEPFFNLFLGETIDGEKGEQGIAAATKNAITNARLQETINPNCSGLEWLIFWIIMMMKKQDFY
jgi:hypothetical protein